MHCRRVNSGPPVTMNGPPRSYRTIFDAQKTTLGRRRLLRSNVKVQSLGSINVEQVVTWNSDPPKPSSIEARTRDVTTSALDDPQLGSLSLGLEKIKSLTLNACSTQVWERVLSVARFSCNFCRSVTRLEDLEGVQYSRYG